MDTPKIIQPQSGGQVKFLSESAKEVLYWGDTGSGKSYAMLIDALGLQFQHTIGKSAYECPDYSAYIFRRQTNRLTLLISKAQQLYTHLGGIYTATKVGHPGPSFTFPNKENPELPGARIFFCHMENEDDKFKYHGQEISYAGFDELTEFLLSQYLYIFTRARSIIPGVFTRIRSTTNAVGVGVRWVRQRFIDSQTPGQVKWFLAAEVPEKNPRGIEVDYGTPDSISRVSVVGELDENKVLLATEPNYRANVKAAGTKMAKALLNKDWYVFEGQFFSTLSRNIHRIPGIDTTDFAIAGGMDWGNVRCCYIARRDTRTMKRYITNGWRIDCRGNNNLKSRGESIISFINWLRHNGLLYVNFKIYADTYMFGKDKTKDELYSTADFFNQALENEGSPVRIVKTSFDYPSDRRSYRIFCNDEVTELLDYQISNSGEYTKEPKLFFFENKVEELFNSLFDLVGDEDNPQDFDTSYDNSHDYDGMKYALMNLRQKSQSEIDKRCEQLSRELTRRGKYARV